MLRSASDSNGERNTTPAVQVVASSDCRSRLPWVRSRPALKYTAFWPTYPGVNAKPLGCPLTPGSCEHSVFTRVWLGLVATLPNGARVRFEQGSWSVQVTTSNTAGENSS